MADTKQQILDAAERLFAEHGIAATSLRSVMAAAGVNPAAVHYHFGGRDELVEAVLLRRLRPLNCERLARLAELEAAVGSGVPEPVAVLEAFVAPALRLACKPDGDGERLMLLLGRFYYQSGDAARALVEREFRPVIERFAGVLARAVPQLDRDVLAWRLHFVIGAMAHTMTCREPASWLGARAPSEPAAVDRVGDELVRFAVAGLGCPVPEEAS
jgi:AcrR family transcriptional regulator